MQEISGGAGKFRRIRSWIACGAIAVAAGIGSTGAQAALYGLANGGALYTINPATGAATFVASVPGVSLTGLSFLRGTLYATDIFQGSDRFGSIDVTTGAFTGINNQENSANWHGLAGNESANVLYTIDIDERFTLTSVTATGVITRIGDGTGIDGRGMAYDDTNGILYATNSLSVEAGGVADLYSVNVATGVATRIGPMGISAQVIGLEYDEIAGILYANDGYVSNSLYSVNTTTGQATLIGANGFAEINGLAWIEDNGNNVPAPGVLPLIMIGATAFVASRRRKR